MPLAGEKLVMVSGVAIIGVLAGFAWMSLTEQSNKNWGEGTANAEYLETK